MNVWPQCNTCNVEKGGNLAKYKAKLISMFSELAIEALYDLSNENTGGLSDHEIREIIDKYK